MQSFLLEKLNEQRGVRESNVLFAPVQARYAVNVSDIWVMDLEL